MNCTECGKDVYKSDLCEDCYGDMFIPPFDLIDEDTDIVIGKPTFRLNGVHIYTPPHANAVLTLEEFSLLRKMLDRFETQNEEEEQLIMRLKVECAVALKTYEN